ncbi:raffinose/stachyose/melibiose transport system permease protein [Enterococcus sp. PF1-24]|uniref:carbohydrate ABC transporter permease n=1 Tax=unclassified Enterococcus TaxID=2608891 RepID=UPI00247431D9|nr:MULTISPECIES: sugar ABC transporter permease [unclassified Enterococcus]MDH6365336.1 raffinose/stachyose/melibiose transport system permease protein [Enterococcus sp. PFB1-1]MDH6402408.1 raffinose/stachyose/melibiose transport system permease protein [Enterococcus sp. PF1-24]
MLTNKSKSFWLLMLPSLLVLVVVLFIPLIIGIYYSLTNWNGNTAADFIGITNYLEIFKDETFINSLIFTAKFSIVSIILINIVALGLAVLVTQKLGKWATIFRTVFFMPNLIGGIILGFIWQFVFNKVFTSFAELTGIAAFENWLSTPQTGFWGLVILFVWQMSGYMMLIYISFLNNIPEEIVEAANIDGASSIQTFFRVKLPMMIPAFTVTLFLTLSNAFKLYDQNLALTGGGPYNSTQMTSMNIYNEAFVMKNMGYAQAKAFVFLLIIVLISVIQISFTRSKETDA